MSGPDTILLARRQVRLLVLAALKQLKTPDVQIQSPGDWNTPSEKMPAILVRCGPETKSQQNRVQPQFETQAVIEIEARLEGGDGAIVQAAIESLAFDLENTLLTDHDLIAFVQRVISIESHTEITADGRRHLAGLKMSWTFEMFESFDPAVINWSEYPALSTVDINLDLVNVFDATGSYTPSGSPPYTPTTAPRTAGPDGRNEGTAEIDLSD